MSARVSVVVVNWNGERYLRDCLGSLMAQTYDHAEVILVDNGSTDGSVELVRRAFPTVRVLRNEANLGFARANNQAIEASEGEFIATLNNDACAEPEWLASLVEAMGNDRSIGSCASKMVFAHRPQVINSTGIMLDRAGIAWGRYGGRADDVESNRACEVFGACAGAALYRRTMLEDVGLFDEDYFAYLEDVDLAWRARLRGWRSLYVPGARVYHVHSGTASEGSPFKSYHLGRNKIWTIVKNYPQPQVLFFLPVIAFYDIASIQYSVLARGDWSPLRGRLDGLRLLGRMLKKRRLIQRRRTVRFAELAAVMAPLTRPDVLLRRYRHLLKNAEGEGTG